MISLSHIPFRRTAKCSNIWQLTTRDPNLLKPNKWGQSTAKADASKSQDTMPGPLQTPQSDQKSASALPVLAPKDPNKPRPQPKSP